MGEKLDTSEAGFNPSGDQTFKVDLQAEIAAIRAFKKAGFKGTVFTEESGLIKLGDKEVYAVLDPLDGSRNAVRGIPFYSASLAISKSPFFRDVVAAGVMDLLRNQLIYSDGYKVYVDGVEARPSTVTNVREAYISILSKLRDYDDVSAEAYGERIMRILRYAGYPRLFGSAALEIAYVAVGLLDAFVDVAPRLRPFDITASLYMVLKAGGYVKTFNVKLNDLKITEIVRVSFIAAGNAELGENIISLLGSLQS